MTESQRKKHSEACTRWRRNHPEQFNEYLRRRYRRRCVSPIPGQRWVADARRALALSQAELAQMCDVAQTTISKIERGITDIENSSAKDRLCEILWGCEG